MTYYSKLVIRRPAPELIFHSVISKFCVERLFLFIIQHLLVSLLVIVATLQALNIVLPRDYFSLYLTLFTILYGCRIFPDLSDCTVNPVKSFLDYSR